MADSSRQSQLKTLLTEELSEYGDLYVPRGKTVKTSPEPVFSSGSQEKIVPRVSPSQSSQSNEIMKELDSIRTLDELRDLCLVSDELKTDLEGTKLVFGIGNPEADLMIIGEAPGEQEDLQGVPFVGRAGKLLDDILKAIQMDRSVVYIANILKHRPPGNRNPSEEERRISLPYLRKQIDLIQPKLLLCLGKIAASTLLDADGSLSEMRGEFHTYGNAELLVTYHPAALLRNPNWKRPTWEDVQLLQKRYVELGCKPELKPVH